ncbi:MAG: hypothetical protein L0H84_05740 [Pseudonocardia sp.]|nr:hypothetical protein [Pseudonocardia sp.]
MSSPSPSRDDPVDTPALAAAYQALLDTADIVAAADGTPRAAPTGEWTADQVLAHVSLVTAVTIAAVATVAAGSNTTYDNRIALDAWTIDRAITLAGGTTGLHRRIRQQGRALCTLAATASRAELDTPVPTLLLSGDAVLVDQNVPLEDLLTGLADTELPGHTAQLRALRAGGVTTRA